MGVVNVLKVVSFPRNHLRNHGFLLTDRGWVLSPAYDMNPVVSGGGLALNISKDDNSQDFDLARSIAPVFRISEQRAKEIIVEIIKVVRTWPGLAKPLKLSAREVSVMKNAFRLVEEE